MELYYPIQASPWHYFLPSHLFIQAHTAAIPDNYVHWAQTHDSHIYTAELPGIRKEDIRVEVEDSIYLVIRTELSGDVEDHDTSTNTRRGMFMRKFRLPQLVSVGGISAEYEDGVLTVTVPRSVVRGRLEINSGELAQERSSIARAA